MSEVAVLDCTSAVTPMPERAALKRLPMLRAIRAEAEAQVALRDYAAAMDRFRAGQDLARHSTAAADHVEASIIDTRARDVQTILREQAAER